MYCYEYFAGGRPSINPNMGRGRGGGMAIKRPASMSARQTPPPKRSLPTDRLVTFIVSSIIGVLWLIFNFFYYLEILIQIS